MQTLIFSFAYLMIFLWVLAIVWALVAEVLNYLNIKSRIGSKLISKLSNVYRRFAAMIHQEQTKRISALGKRLSHTS